MHTSNMINPSGEAAGPPHVAHRRLSGRSTYRESMSTLPPVAEGDQSDSEDAGSGNTQAAHAGNNSAGTRAGPRATSSNSRPSSPQRPSQTKPPNCRHSVSSRAITTVFAWIADRSRVHHWYWALGLVAVMLYTIQAATHEPSNIWRHLAYTVVIYGTASIMMVEQLIAKFVMLRKIMVAEFLISFLVVSLSAVGWTFWSLRRRDPLFEPLGSCCFDLVEVVLMLRFAYRSLVGNFDEYSIRPSPSTYQDWHHDLEAGRLVDLPVDPPQAHINHGDQTCSACPRCSFRNSYNKDLSSARSSSSYGTADTRLPRL